MRAQRSRRKEQIGVVVSDRMAKTRVVRVETLRRHALYKKTVRHVRRFKAHDEQNVSRVGDVVLLMETRPLSKDKRWRIVRVVEHRTPAAVMPGGDAETEPGQ